MLRNKAVLKEMQSLPLDEKIEISEERIREWYEHWHGQVHVSFSGGKDSTVLLHLVRSMYPEVKAVYVNTGLEDPTVQQFARQMDNVEILRPKLTFKEVVTDYGYPLVSKEVAECIYYARRFTPSYIELLKGTYPMSRKVIKHVQSIGGGFDFTTSHPGKKRKELFGEREWNRSGIRVQTDGSAGPEGQFGLFGGGSRRRHLPAEC